MWIGFTGVRDSRRRHITKPSSDPMARAIVGSGTGTTPLWPPKLVGEFVALVIVLPLYIRLREFVPLVGSWPAEKLKVFRPAKFKVSADVLKKLLLGSG